MMLKPLELIYHWLGDVRNLFFRNNFLKSRRLEVPVISVGNLSFGGVGKTPCIVFLANELSNEYKITVIAKSYKGSLKTPACVNPQEPERFGDEACLLAKNLPQCQVWAGPVKWKTAMLAHKHRNGIVLLDDGFSHRELARNFDLVLIDALAGLDGYHRERMTSLGRASAILITKTNLAGAEKTAMLKQQLRSFIKDTLIFTAISVSSLKLQPQSELFVFCGLGNPKGFQRDLEMQGFIIRKKQFFDDHHRFSASEQKNLIEIFSKLRKKHPHLKMVCTEKDFVKISNEELKSHVHVVQHSLQMSENEKRSLLAQVRNSL